MDQEFIHNRIFSKTNFREIPLKSDYENCTFHNCDFSETSLSGIRFIDCSFTGCNLSMAKLAKTVLRDITFRDCKMLGLRFDTCSGFCLSFSFENCTLDHSSFYQLKIRNTRFKNVQLKDVDFTNCDLSGSVFDNCNFSGATFENTILELADLRTSYNYSLDPEKNKLKKARFALPEVTGLLDKYNIVIDQPGYSTPGI